METWGSKSEGGGIKKQSSKSTESQGN